MKKILCDKNGKRRFPTRWHAEIRLLAVQKRVEVPLYTYQCEHCGSWHFTKRLEFSRLIELHL